jgi:hypothetical protein
MNKSFSKIRHIRNSNMILENRVLNEETPPTSDSNQSQSGQGDRPEPIPGDMVNCAKIMRGDGRPGSGTSAEGPFDKITSNGSVAPGYQRYILYKEGRPFCFIER